MTDDLNEGERQLNEDERLLRRTDGEWNEAYPRRDLDALARIIADDWFCIDGAGRRIGKSELLERVASNPNPFESHVFDETEFRVFDGASVVTGRLSGSGRDESGEFRLRQRYTRVYVKRGGEWRAVTTQVTVVKDE